MRVLKVLNNLKCDDMIQISDRENGKVSVKRPVEAKWCSKSVLCNSHFRVKHCYWCEIRPDGVKSPQIKTQTGDLRPTQLH